MGPWARFGAHSPDKEWISCRSVSPQKFWGIPSGLYKILKWHSHYLSGGSVYVFIIIKNNVLFIIVTSLSIFTGIFSFSYLWFSIFIILLGWDFVQDSLRKHLCEIKTKDGVLYIWHLKDSIVNREAVSCRWAWTPMCLKGNINCKKYFSKEHSVWGIYAGVYQSVVLNVINLIF